MNIEERYVIEKRFRKELSKSSCLFANDIKILLFCWDGAYSQKSMLDENKNWKSSNVSRICKKLTGMSLLNRELLDDNTIVYNTNLLWVNDCINSKVEVKDED